MALAADVDDDKVDALALGVSASASEIAGGSSDDDAEKPRGRGELCLSMDEGSQRREESLKCSDQQTHPHVSGRRGSACVAERARA